MTSIEDEIYPQRAQRIQIAQKTQRTQRTGRANALKKSMIIQVPLSGID
jgi:hypothetical protein